MSIEIPQSIIEKASTFTGNGHHLESALGAYALGQLYGWRVLRMLHGSRIVRRHERALGVCFQEVCPERTSLSDRVLGIRIADMAGAFWPIATGQRAGRERFEFSSTDQGALL